ncbi:MAG: ABC transporter ATP-binding protein [Thermoguttaceae bacterium]
MLPILQMQRVTKRFGRQTALENVSFSVDPGTIFALLGENGAGKTTAIRILLGLLTPDEGRSEVLGWDSQKDDLTIRQRVGYVPEQPTLYDWMTVLEIGRFLCAFYPDGYLREFLRTTEQYQLPLSAKISSLSKGMRAKVSLALALALDPELLILDEPTSGLDPLVRREFLESMVERAATGKSVFLSSHQIAEVERVADVVAIIKKSKLILVESLNTLKEQVRSVTLTLKQEDATFTIPFETVIQEQKQGRQVKLIGRNLNPAVESLYGDDSSVIQHDIRVPDLEEIFIAYMNS